MVRYDLSDGSRQLRLRCKAAAGQRDIRLPRPVHPADGGVAQRGHHSGHAATLHLGAILSARDIVAPMALVGDLLMPMVPAQQALWTGLVRGKGDDPMEDFAVGFPTLHASDTALNVEHTGAAPASG